MHRCISNDVLGILPTGFGKILIYQLLPKVFASYWFAKTGEKKTCNVIVVSPLELIRKQ
jgi:superfamily II DNA helicase RecQ